MADHVHILISMPPVYPVAQEIGYIKGNNATQIARVYARRRRNLVGQHFWATGYWVTVGKSDAAVRRCIQEQEKEDIRLDKIELPAL